MSLTQTALYIFAPMVLIVCTLIGFSEAKQKTGRRRVLTILGYLGFGLVWALVIVKAIHNIETRSIGFPSY